MRNRLLVHNIANMTTPEFEAMDVSVTAFQKTLSDAMERRRNSTGGQRGELELSGNDELVPTGGGGFVLNPQTQAEGIPIQGWDAEELGKADASLARTLRCSGRRRICGGNSTT